MFLFLLNAADFTPYYQPTPMNSLSGILLMWYNFKENKRMEMRKK